MGDAELDLSDPARDREKTTRDRGRRPRISRKQIVEAACRIGLKDLTLALVAKNLGVTVQALYHYVQDKDGLSELVADELVLDYPLPEYNGEDWCEWAYRYAYTQLRMFRAIPGLAHVAMSRTIQAALFRLNESVRIAKLSGFDETMSWWVTRAVQEFCFSWMVRVEVRADQSLRSGTSYIDGLRQLVRETGAAGLPDLDRAINQHVDELEDARFDATLRALLLGLSSLRQTSVGMQAAVARTEVAPAVPKK